MANSTVFTKPAKPYHDFPLFPHATKRWAKKIRGKLHYFGPWSEPDAALNKYLDQRDDLHAGRVPRVSGETLTVRDLCNRFLTVKEQQRDSGDITGITFADYLRTCAAIVNSFGKTRLVDDLAADDFESLRSSLAKQYGPHRLGNTVQRIRSVFKYSYDAGLIDKPVRFGPAFKRPSARLHRLHRQKNGARMFAPADLRKIIETADQPLKSMILLGINCGFGNNDCGTLPLSALDLKTGWVNYPRPKTAIERRCPLWPETVATVKDAITKRPTPKLLEQASLVFITKYGAAWAKKTEDNPITKEMRKLLDELMLYRRGMGFYALRHTFETIAGECRDQVAVNHIMGHADASMAGAYREHISDARLRDAVNVVRAWLFPKKKRCK